MTKQKMLSLVLLCCLCLPLMALGEEGPMPEIAYVGTALNNVRIRSEMADEAETLGALSKDEQVNILSYEPQWVEVVRGNEQKWVRGFIPRSTVDQVTTIKEGILPYGALPALYTATIAERTLLLDRPEEGGEILFALNPGVPLAILSIADGWAKTLFFRQYAYVYVGALMDLTPIYAPGRAATGDSIGAFVTFYSVEDSEVNQSRIRNIQRACDYITLTLSPGEVFAFDSIAGPYTAARGFEKAMSYYEGEPALSTGGGVCQVSSTLYNVLLSLPEGMRVTHRRAHGATGAPYLPLGTDAAVGGERLDLVFENTYDFPVTIDARAFDGALFITIKKGEVMP